MTIRHYPQVLTHLPCPIQHLCIRSLPCFSFSGQDKKKEAEAEEEEEDDDYHDDDDQSA